MKLEKYTYHYQSLVGLSKELEIMKKFVKQLKVNIPKPNTEKISCKLKLYSLSSLFSSNY